MTNAERMRQLIDELELEMAGNKLPSAPAVLQNGKKVLTEDQTTTIEENLRDWFNQKWVRFGPDGKIRGACARGSDKEGKPKCLPQAKAHALGKKKRATAARRKRREDPHADRRGAAKNVHTNESIAEDSALSAAIRRVQHLLNDRFGANLDVDGIFGPLTLQSINMFMPGADFGPAPHPDRTTAVQGLQTKPVRADTCPFCGGEMYDVDTMLENKDACYYKVKRRYKVWPSAYASGALVQCRKRGAKNWGKSQTNENSSGRFDAIPSAVTKDGQLTNAHFKQNSRDHANVRMDRQQVDENMDHSKDTQAVAELAAALLARKRSLKRLKNNTEKLYSEIDQLMTTVAKTHGISGQKLHDMWIAKYHEVPDTWIQLAEIDHVDEAWSKKYKKSINCSNPKGFSQKAHCAARRKRQRHQPTKSKSVSENQNPVDNENLISVNNAKILMPQILSKVQKIYDDWDESDRDTYAGGGICHLLSDAICNILNDNDIDSTPVSCTMEQHVYVVAKFQEGIYEVDIPYHVYEIGGGYSWSKIPDVKFEPSDVRFQKLSGDPNQWENYIEENFADGRGPGRPGDSARHGIPRHATLAQLDVIGQGKGRKAQLARWQANMRRGRKK